MYLARYLVHRRYHFVIRESYRDGDVLRSRDLLEIGPAPQAWIRYADNRVFHVDDRIMTGLVENGADPDPFELEELFLPFVDPEIRCRVDSMANRSRHRSWKPTSARQRGEILAATHEFDRRRVHFLRFGQTDQRRLNRSAPLFKTLLAKSRDELEQFFLRQEQELKPHEYKRYIFTIFDLQRFFSQSYAATMPEALGEDEMDDCFIKQVCALDADTEFWRGLPRNGTLPDYLVRYVIMYFDFVFPGSGGWREDLNRYMNGRRYARPGGGARVSLSEAATVFGLSRAELSELSASELKKLFRKKAREVHPDQGGDHERFIELANAYQEMLRTRAGKP